MCFENIIFFIFLLGLRKKYKTLKYFLAYFILIILFLRIRN